MVKESLALLRVGEWADLSDDELHTYLDLASSVEAKVLEDSEHLQEKVGEEYFDFLNEHVLSDERVVKHLESADMPVSKLEDFENGSVPVTETYSKRYKLHYGLDKIADFVMLMKLIREYEKETGERGIAPRDKLQYLAYLVNYQLSQKDDLRPESMRTSLKNLEHTGYRYTFNKAKSGPLSPKLYRDKNRLFANQLLNEEVMEDSVSEYDEPYRITLGEVGERIFARYEDHLSSFDSVLMVEWDHRQQDVLEEYAAMSYSQLRNEVQSMPKFQSKDEGDELLEGRIRDFDEITPMTTSLVEVATLVQ
ncbi:hypothetical protein OB919_20760 [Halobacteria archaeon AArc-curdl1]|uniref:Uncharacterized protein n=1 Tax=Natronosalvus hydrolyticus TaxID=2979988 RepID=A0AAP2ZBW9_9EURY|nr:hypothetical protein [Halobacteria archaeon AArc-curdl1]